MGTRRKANKKESKDAGTDGRGVRKKKRIAVSQATQKKLLAESGLALAVLQERGVNCAVGGLVEKGRPDRLARMLQQRSWGCGRSVYER